MEPIRNDIQSFLGPGSAIGSRSLSEIRKSEGLPVSNYAELVKNLAELAFENPEFILLMRGQHTDYCSTAGSTLFPWMYRNAVGEGESTEIYASELRSRYEKLEEKERLLYDIFNGHYRKRVGRSKLLRWAILQHYEVCPTPLLDVTHSARVAASFAFQKAPPGQEYVYFYVLGLPQIHGSVTVVSEQAIQIVRLASVCPPTTLRPYFQEGYLLGTYPPVDTLDEKMRYARSEMDCAHRLIAKFRLKKEGFWNEEFQPLRNTALYPEEDNDINRQILALKDPD
jgi:hypothetical protein